LERKIGDVGKIADQANTTAEKALKCCRKDYTVLLTKEINFDFNKFDLRPDARAILDTVAMKLQSDPDLIAELGGNCDSVGTVDYNIVLGQKRADAARMYLVSQHRINFGRLAIRTFGKTSPIATNESDVGRASNRRVSIDILGYAQ
jgi:outer membrane protein OmpA-like peptidoglycan-associated protein